VATTLSYTLALHDALPIFPPRCDVSGGDRCPAQRASQKQIGFCGSGFSRELFAPASTSGKLAAEAAPTRASRFAKQPRCAATCSDRKSTRLNSSHVKISYA